MYLPEGTTLNSRYVIETVLGQGGFGITYAAYDKTVGGRVAIKEYLPRHLATRREGKTRVSVFSGEARQHFDYGLKKFVEEARALTQFVHHPNVVSARDYFEAHGTAYMVMEYAEGVTLKEYLDNKGGRISFEEARGIMMPVMDALREVHQVGLLHRDISPDNIYITTAAQVRVIDFGAARYYVGEQSKSLSVILKPGYAPEEQYRSSGKQGAWTDVYAVGATIYKCLTGKTPPDALDRKEEDTLEPPSRLGVDIPPSAERALLKALAINAGQRFQTMGEFQQALMDGQPLSTGLQPAARASPTPSSAATPTPMAAQPPPQPQRPVLGRRPSLAAVAAAIGGGLIGLVLMLVLIIQVILPAILDTVSKVRHEAVQREAREKEERNKKEAAEKARLEGQRRKEAERRAQEEERQRKKELERREATQREAREKQERAQKEAAERAREEENRRKEAERKEKQLLVEEERKRQEAARQEERRRSDEQTRREAEQRQAQERERQRQEALRAIPTQSDRVIIESLGINPPFWQSGQTVTVECGYTVLSGNSQQMPVEVKVSIIFMNNLVMPPVIKNMVLSSGSYVFHFPLTISHSLPKGNYTISAEVKTSNNRDGKISNFWIR